MSREADIGPWVLLFLLLGGALYYFRAETRFYDPETGEGVELPDVSELIAAKAAELGLSAQVYLARVEARAAELGMSRDDYLAYQIPELAELWGIS